MGCNPIIGALLQLFYERTDWGLALTGFGRPFGLGLDNQGRLLIADMDCHVVVRWDLDLHIYQCHFGVGERWGPAMSALPGQSLTRPKRPSVGWNGPHSAVCDASGRVVVTCYYRPAIVNVPPNDVAELIVGSDLLAGPASTTIDAQGRLLVAEYAKNLVMVFDACGRYLGRIGRNAEGEALQFDPDHAAETPSDGCGGFDRPHMAISTPDGCIVVADTWNNRIQKLSSSGDYLCMLDDMTGWKTAPDPSIWKRDGAHGVIPCPVAIDQDACGRILVTAWGSNQLFLLESDGSGAELSVPPAFCKPYDARFQKNGIAIADTHNGRVLIVEDIFN